MITIQLKRNVSLPVDKAILQYAAQMTLETTNTPLDSELSIVIGSDAFVHRLNAKYRKVDAPTDVLSFMAGEFDPDTRGVYLGDVVISLPRAQDQAAGGGHSVVEELQLLVVHGVLHLLGYDHSGADDSQKMQLVQDQILENLGLKLDVEL